MAYTIINKRGIPLSGFHQNGGWQLKDVFPCSKYSWISFKTKEKAENYLKYIREECYLQYARWGDWYAVAMRFVNKLSIEKLNISTFENIKED